MACTCDPAAVVARIGDALAARAAIAGAAPLARIGTLEEFLRELELAVDHLVADHNSRKPHDPIQNETKWRNAVRGDLILHREKVPDLATKSRARTGAPPSPPPAASRPSDPKGTGFEDGRRGREELQALYERLPAPDRETIDAEVAHFVPVSPPDASEMTKSIRALRALTRRNELLEDLRRDRRLVS